MLLTAAAGTHAVTTPAGLRDSFLSGNVQSQALQHRGTAVESSGQSHKSCAMARSVILVISGLKQGRNDARNTKEQLPQRLERMLLEVSESPKPTFGWELSHFCKPSAKFTFQTASAMANPAPYLSSPCEKQSSAQTVVAWPGGKGISCDGLQKTKANVFFRAVLCLATSNALHKNAVLHQKSWGQWRGGAPDAEAASVCQARHPMPRLKHPWPFFGLQTFHTPSFLSFKPGDPLLATSLPSHVLNTLSSQQDKQTR